MTNIDFDDSLSEEQTLAFAERASAAVKDAISWLANPSNAERVGNKRGILNQALMRASINARRLRQASSRPMAVAVFGPSQVGKSHLISVLARKGERFLADFDGVDEPVSYIGKINPDKGKEATGLVTRFTLKRSPCPSGFPAQIRLLEHADIIKIIANSYFYDGMPHKYGERVPSVEDLRKHAAEFRAAAGAQDRAEVNGLQEEDVWDLGDYMNRYLEQSQLTRALKDADFWPIIAGIAPRLDIPRLGRLLSVLWGGHAPLTELYVRLASALASLGFPNDAFVSLDAIDATSPTARSILDVECLQDLDAGKDGTVGVCTAAGTVVDMPRALVSILTAELRICLHEKPHEFFEYTDLLDFPGYRTRGITAIVASDGSSASADSEEDGAPRGLAAAFQKTPGTILAGMLLRGKVEYLFQRYVADQEITAMLFCNKESNLEVIQLPEVLQRWIAVTHGARPHDRLDKRPLLFFVLTRFDVHFEKKIDDSVGLGRRFDGRMEGSLVAPFGATPESWAQQWTPDVPFNNCYLMRNPNVLNEVMFEIADKRELSLKSEAWAGDLKAAFVSSAAVQRHFRDPARAFDEMLRLNDGGASYIAAGLTPVCDPVVKKKQVTTRLIELQTAVRNSLKPYFIETDVQRRIGERLQMAQVIIKELMVCETARRMGTLMRGFMIEDIPLRDRLYRDGFEQAPAKGGGSEGAPELTAATPGGESLRELLEAPRSDAPATELQHRILEKVQAALAAWIQSMYDVTSSPGFASEVRVTNETLRRVADELVEASMRLGLGEKMVAVAARQVHVADLRDRQIDKIAVIAGKLINGFVADFGLGSLPVDQRTVSIGGGDARQLFIERPVAYDPDGIGPVAVPFARNASREWMYAFYKTVGANAASIQGQNIDHAENARLGDILTRLGM